MEGTWRYDRVVGALSECDAVPLEGEPVFFVKRDKPHGNGSVALAQIIPFSGLERRAYEREPVVAVVGGYAADSEQGVKDGSRIEGSCVVGSGLSLVVRVSPDILRRKPKDTRDMQLVVGGTGRRMEESAAVVVEQVLPVVRQVEHGGRMAGTGEPLDNLVEQSVGGYDRVVVGIGHRQSVFTVYLVDAVGGEDSAVEAVSLVIVEVGAVGVQDDKLFLRSAVEQRVEQRQ